MDRLTSMAVFVKAAESGSFSAAALAFGISSQMAGRHVNALEARVGAPLLARTTRSQRLTEIGQLFYERCKILLADAEAAESVAKDFSASPRGRLRVTAPVTFGNHCLAPLVTRYLRDFPDVQVDLTLTDRFVDLVDESFEVAIRLGVLSDSSLIARPLQPYRLLACASPAYLKARGEPETPAALTGHECLGFAFTALPPYNEWVFGGPSDRPGRESNEKHAVTVSGRFQANDVKALITAALDGFGIALAPEAAVRGYIARGALVQLLPRYKSPERPMHLVYTAKRPTPKLRAFIDQVLEAFGGPAGRRD